MCAWVFLMEAKFMMDPQLFLAVRLCDNFTVCVVTCKIGCSVNLSLSLSQ